MKREPIFFAGWELRYGFVVTARSGNKTTVGWNGDNVTIKSPASFVGIQISATAGGEPIVFDDGKFPDRVLSCTVQSVFKKNVVITARNAAGAEEVLHIF